MHNSIFRKHIAFVALLFAFLSQLPAQEVPEHVSNTAIYDFMDELANEKIISINSVVKPYSKQFILKKLQKAEEKDSLLNKRQRKEVDFYLKAYQIWDNQNHNPYHDEKVNLLKKYSDHAALSFTHLGFVHRDTNFTVTAAPVWGFNYRSNDNGTVNHFWGGVEAHATLGKHIGFYASLRDNSITEILAWPENLTRQEAGNYKIGNGGRPGGDYSEMRGGIFYSWKWGRIGLVKDHVQWGDNYHGASIIDSRAPSFAMIKMHLKPAKWFEFDYFHGWLVSEVIDSVQSYVSQYGESRQVFRPKNIAANIYTLHPWPTMSLSLGNSIIYSDMGGAHPAYMIPFLFYKSIDHTLNHSIQNQNSQLFLNASIRSIKHVHLYGSLFVDEFSKTRVGVDTLHNFLSWKGGLKLSNWPVQNIALTYEFTQTYPLTYKHRIEATTFATNKIGLGHYLKDNSREHYGAIAFKPLSRLRIKAEYWQAVHYNDYQYNVQYDTKIDALPVLQNKTWQNKTFRISASYELLQNVYIKLLFEDSRIRGFDVDGYTAEHYLATFTPGFYYGNQQTISFQFNIGF